MHSSICETYVVYLVEAWYSLEQYIGLKEDKLSSTTVDFIRSEGNLETKCLYWFRGEGEVHLPWVYVHSS